MVFDQRLELEEVDLEGVAGELVPEPVPQDPTVRTPTQVQKVSVVAVVAQGLRFDL